MRTEIQNMRILEKFLTNGWRMRTDVAVYPFGRDKSEDYKNEINCLPADLSHWEVKIWMK